MAWGREQCSEGVREGEGKKRRLRGKDDTQVTFSCLLSFHIQMHWLVRYSNMVSKASEGRHACSGWWYTELGLMNPTVSGLMRSTNLSSFVIIPKTN